LFKCGWRGCIRLELHHHIQKSTNEKASWIILVNGLFADLHSYDEVVKNLGDEFHILRYDCRGQGKSIKPIGVYTLSEHVLDLEKLIFKRGITELTILGLSNGGRIALEFARRNSELVKGVIACDTYDSPSELLKLKLQSWLAAFEKGGETHRFDVATPWIWSESLLKKNPKLIEFYRSKAGDIEECAVRGLILGAMKSSIPIEEIKCPIFFIVGREDVLTPPYTHEDMLSKSTKSLTRNKLSIVPGGHASILEFPQTVVEEIVPFVRSLR
jgi:3-oxoadipate enol-lactonase